MSRELQLGKYEFFPNDDQLKRLKDLTGISEEAEDFLKRFMQNERADARKKRKKKVKSKD